MTRAALVRGIQLVVTITLGAFALLIWRGVASQQADLAAGLAGLRPGWLAVAAVLALQEGVCGGVRIWLLGRVLDPALRLRTAVVSELVLMFCAGVTPGQVGAPVAQVAVLAHGGMRFADAATAELMTAACTIVFFLATALLVFVLRMRGLLVVAGGEQIDWLLGVSVVCFGVALVVLVLCAAYPPILSGAIRRLAGPLGTGWRALLRLALRAGPLRARAEQALARPGAVRDRLLAGVRDVHEGFGVYLRRGKTAYVLAQLVTFAFFSSRFAVAYFVLLALGVPTTPSTFVSKGPPIVQVVLVQTLLNFALYLSPTPGASGIAEAGSNALMSPWVRGVYELPYLVLWRFLSLFLCMFVGGLYVFRYLGTDVLEARVREANEAKRALERAHLACDAATDAAPSAARSGSLDAASASPSTSPGSERRRSA